MLYLLRLGWQRSAFDFDTGPGTVVSDWRLVLLFRLSFSQRAKSVIGSSNDVHYSTKEGE